MPSPIRYCDRKNGLSGCGSSVTEDINTASACPVKLWHPAHFQAMLLSVSLLVELGGVFEMYSTKFSGAIALIFLF